MQQILLMKLAQLSYFYADARKKKTKDKVTLLIKSYFTPYSIHFRKRDSSEDVL